MNCEYSASIVTFMNACSANRILVATGEAVRRYRAAAAKCGVNVVARKK